MALIDLPTEEEALNDHGEPLREALDGNRYAGEDSPYRRARFHNPVLLEAQNQYNKALLEAGIIDDVLYEYVMVAVAQTNECEYCTASHRKKLKERADLELSDIMAIRKGEFEAFDEPQATLMAFAEKTTRDPHSVDEDDIQDLYDVGLDDGDVMQLLAVIGSCSTSNTTVTALDISPQDRRDDLSDYEGV